MEKFTKTSLLFCYYVCIIQFPVCTEAGLMEDLKGLKNKAYEYVYSETCEHPNVRDPEDAIKHLKTVLKKDLFGQHLVNHITVTAIKAHLEDPSPSKALVLSFHGWAGGGKTFTSTKIMDSLYNKGIDSDFVRFFQSSYHFPDPKATTEYQQLIRRNVEEVVKKCERGMFIFDEVDKMPPQVLDALVPYIDHPALLEGTNYKKSIFIFLSNVGATEINQIAHQAWLDGKRREHLTFKDFDQVLSNEAFNSESGLYKSGMINKVLVDYFIPYLPLERQHVISCIKVAAKHHRMPARLVEDEAEIIADLMTYYPPDINLYSTTGCKKVDTYVKYRMSEQELAEESKAESDKAYNEEGDKLTEKVKSKTDL